jgi:hypothetical protein
MPSLDDVARDMERRAKRNQVCIVDLTRGLSLKLVICGGQRVLSLSRPAVLPAVEEIGVCRKAFGVPADARVEMTNTEVTYRWTPS